MNKMNRKAVKTITNTKTEEFFSLTTKLTVSDFEVKSYKKVITPNFCKQLQIVVTTSPLLSVKQERKLIESLMSEVRAFCNEVYHTSYMYGCTMRGKRVVGLSTSNDTIYFALEKGCPQRVNPEVNEIKFVRQLTCNKDSKMSKKLWSATDWLLKK